MDTVKTVIKILFILLNLALTVLILKQDAKERGFGRGATAPQSYLTRTKRKSAEDMQVIATRVMILLYAAAAVALLLLGM